MKIATSIHPALFRRIAAILGITLVPEIATAHDGHHMTRIVSDVEAIAVAGSRMTLTLAVSNYSEGEVVLQAISVPNAESMSIAPVLIAPGGQQDVDVTLFFETPIPGIFTAVLDFGSDGQGPVLVMN